MVWWLICSSSAISLLLLPADNFLTISLSLKLRTSALGTDISVRFRQGRSELMKASDRVFREYHNSPFVIALIACGMISTVHCGTKCPLPLAQALLFQYHRFSKLLLKKHQNLLHCFR